MCLYRAIGLPACAFLASGTDHCKLAPGQIVTPAGYLAKDIQIATQWLGNKRVEDIWSVSNCVSGAFCDYIGYWKHNGYWLFDSAQVVRELADREGVDCSRLRLFYYEVHEEQYDNDVGAWSAFCPDAAFVTNVRPLATRQRAGFDVVSFSAWNAPECSPLSCNGLAGSIDVNSHCLLDTFEQAKALLECGRVRDCEPGPYRIFSVYPVPFP
jgi:hypothetical protein